MDLLRISAYIVPFVIAMAVAVVLTWLVRRIALRYQVVDRPETDPERKAQKKPVPLLGGVAIFGAVLLVVVGYALFTERLIGGYLLPKHLIGIGVGGLLLMIGGLLDDRFHVSPAKQIIWPIVAAVVVIISGIGVTYISNPFGGVLYLDSIQWKLFTVGDTPYHIVVLADIFAFLWLMGMMYTTKFLDGLDGLVSGITTIGAAILLFLSISQDVGQPETALIAAIVAGAAAGFLLFNFHPAKIYLGEGGSVFAGFMLGTLAILSGAKIATALLIMGIPILDVLWVIIRRLAKGESPFHTADTKHLHFQLLHIGFSHRVAVLLLYTITIFFGGTAIFLSNSQEKLWAMIALLGVMVALVVAIVVQYKHKKISNE